MRFSVFFSILLVFFCSLTQEAYAFPAYETQVSKKQIHLNETTVLTINIAWTEPISYEFELPKFDLENLELTNQGENQETFLKNGQQHYKKTYRLTLTPLKSGRALLRPFSLKFTNPESGAEDFLLIPEFSFQIEEKPFPIVPLLGGILGLVAAILGGIFFFHRRKEKESALSVITTPEGEAIAALDQINTHVSEEQAKNTLMELDQELKRYIAKHYQVSTSKSTEELTALLKDQKTSSEEIEALEKILNKLHEAKFMQSSLNETELRFLKKEMIRFIEGRKVVGEPETAAV